MCIYCQLNLYTTTSIVSTVYQHKVKKTLFDSSLPPFLSSNHTHLSFKRERANNNDHFWGPASRRAVDIARAAHIDGVSRLRPATSPAATVGDRPSPSLRQPLLSDVRRCARAAPPGGLPPTLGRPRLQLQKHKWKEQGQASQCGEPHSSPLCRRPAGRGESVLFTLFYSMAKA